MSGDLLRAVYVLEYDPESRCLIATERLGPDEFGASSIVARDVSPEWAAAFIAAWGHG